MSTEITTVNAQTLEQRPADLLSAIAMAAIDPRVDALKMQQLYALHKEIIADQRQVAFRAALARVQAKMPQIEKDGMIVVKGIERSRYSKLETIDDRIKPIYTAEGFALAYNTESKDGKMFTISCTLSHSDGHSETKSLMVPMDASNFRSDVQSIGSSLSYAKRQLVKMHFNIIEKDEDDDGSGGGELISKDNVQELNTMIKDTNSNLVGFLKFMGVESLEQIRKKDLRRAVNALEQKRERNQ